LHPLKNISGQALFTTVRLRAIAYKCIR